MIVDFYGTFYDKDPKVLGNTERKCIDFLTNNIKSNSTYHSNLIINCTWLDPEDTNLVPWVKQHLIPNSTKLYIVALIDNMHWFTVGKTMNILKGLGCDVEYYGFHIDNWYSFFPSILKKYEQSDVHLDENPNYLYLSYNRKPSTHRISLVKKLVDNQLIDRGYITFEKNYFKEVDIKTETTDQTLHTSDLRYSRPEDVLTLGNLDIWNQSYLIIVSETTTLDPWHLSEKIWKPILGLRPFLLNGNSESYKLLRKLNFYTPADLFKDIELNKADPNVVYTKIKSLYSIEPIELYELWCKQKDMLVHNRNAFLQLSKRQIL